VAGDGDAGDALTVFEATVLEEDESALSDELREHAIRPANAGSRREVNLVIDPERYSGPEAPRLLIRVGPQEGTCQ
jgi:hypothetical protein